MRRTFWKMATPFVRLANRFGLLSYEWVNVCTGAWRRDLFDPLWHFERYGTPVAALPDFVVLAGIGYRTAVADGLVIFKGDDFHERLVFERDPHEPLAMLWYVEISGRMAATHIDEAYRWVKAVFGGSFVKRAAPHQEKP